VLPTENGLDELLQSADVNINIPFPLQPHQEIEYISSSLKV
jgi:hypothetical protein